MSYRGNVLLDQSMGQQFGTLGNSRSIWSEAFGEIVAAVQERVSAMEPPGLVDPVIISGRRLLLLPLPPGATTAVSFTPQGRGSDSERFHVSRVPTQATEPEYVWNIVPQPNGRWRLLDRGKPISVAEAADCLVALARKCVV